MIPHMEGRRPPPTPSPPGQEKLSPEEIQQRLNEAFAGMLLNGGTRRTLPEPPREPPPSLSLEEIQQRLDELFPDMAPRPKPPVESRQPDPQPKEIQQRLNDAFAAHEWSKSLPRLTPSPRRLRSMLRSLRSRSRPEATTGGPSRRRRCDARVKNLFRIGNNGVRVSRGLFCKAWAMENGRCRVHGGLSTGPRSPEGRARVVAAMVIGRRKWVERRRAEEKKFPAGRKTGSAWVTEPMRECARAEAHRLKGGRFTLDRALALALLASAKGDHVRQAKARAMLDAQEQAAAERQRQEGPTRADLLRVEADLQAALRASR
jgi:hypothetical protein